MLSRSIIKKIYTENPFVDSLLYFTKLLAYDSVVKVEDMADQYETAKSAFEGDIYVACIEGHESFELFEYTMTDLWNVGITNYNQRVSMCRNKDLIPEEYRDALTQIGKTRFLEEYEEGNDYYRMICGLPNLNDSGIPVILYENYFPEGIEYNGSEYVHQLGYRTCQMLDRYGIIDMMKEDYPEAKYLNFITYGITPYKARKGFNFQLLYKPDIGMKEIEELYEAKFDENRNYMIQSMRTEAMKLRSQYYDHFMAIMIILMTITDVINETAEHLVKKDILDMRCVKYIFEMYGVPYYKEIPLMYQQRIAKTIHGLIKDKSCLRCMEAFIDLFGCGDIVLFKYYILRDRLQDSVANEYAYTEMIETILQENNVIATDEITVDTSQLDADVQYANLQIPFPFKWFLERGNLMYVFVGENKERIVQGEDFDIINGNQIYFLNEDYKSETLLTFKFYWDIRTENQDNVPNTKESLQLHFRVYNNVVDSFVPYQLPPGAIFTPDKTDLLVIVDGAIINNNLYSISDDATKILLDESLDIGPGSARNAQVAVGYFHGVKFTPCYEKKQVTATVTDQSIFFVPEPFPKYCEYGNKFFITLGDVLIEDSRYKLEQDGTQYKITLTDMTLDIGRSIFFHFLYNAKGVYVPLTYYESQITLTATVDDQILFDLPFPVDHYVERGYRVYVKYNDWFLSDLYFNIFTNKLQFTTQVLSIDVGDTIEVYFKYSSTHENVTVLHDYVLTKKKHQKKFTIKYPMTPYYDGNNLIILDYEGWPLKEGTDFHWTNTAKTELMIDNTDILELEGLRLHITYIFNEVYTRDKFTIKYERLKAEETGQREFIFKFPFYPYIETGHNFLVIHHTKVIPETEFILETYEPDSPHYTIDGMKESKITFKTLDTVQQGDEILIVMFYNERYALLPMTNLTVREVTKSIEDATIEERYYVQDPSLPYPDFIEKGWPMFLMCDNNDRLVPESDYEVIEGKMMIDPDKALNQYGERLTYVYIYKDEDPFIQIDLRHEDIESDIDLHFIRIPMEDERPLENLKQRYLFRKYDIVTVQDPFWDDEAERPGYHSVLRSFIKERPWNYSRTKYIGVSFLVDASEAMLQLAYFQSMWYDKWKYEEELTLEIPFLAPSHVFRYSDVFTFLTILTHVFTGYTDALLDTRTQVLWVRYQMGFNFDADMEVIRRWMREDYYKHDYEYPEVFGFMFEDNPEFEIEDFLEVYRTNSELCKLMLHRMANARDLDEYNIWKRFYQSLMLHEENMDFFKLPDGTIPETFTEFLQTRDLVLYNKVLEISGIADVESQQETIIETVNNVLYVLQEYIDADEFKAIYNQYPGVSGEYIAQYVYLMINFFKSYKVEWIPGGMGDKLMEFNDPDRNIVRPIDVIDYCTHYDMDEYVAIIEVHDDHVHFSEEDHVNIKEMFLLTTALEGQAITPVDVNFTVEVCKGIVPPYVIDFEFEIPKIAMDPIEIKFTYTGVRHIEPPLDIDFKFEVPKLPMDPTEIIFTYEGERKIDGVDIDFEVTCIKELVFSGTSHVLTLWNGVDKEYREEITITGTTSFPLEYISVNGEHIKFTGVGTRTTDKDQKAVVTRNPITGMITVKISRKLPTARVAGFTDSLEEPWTRYWPSKGADEYTTIVDNIVRTTHSDEPEELYSGDFVADMAKIETKYTNQQAPILFPSWSLEYNESGPFAYNTNLNLQLIGAVGALAKYSFGKGTLSDVIGTALPEEPYDVITTIVNNYNNFLTRTSDSEKYLSSQITIDHYEIASASAPVNARCNQYVAAYTDADKDISYI